MKGILGQKLGMTQVFLDNDKVVSVTIVKVKPNVVTKVMTKESDKYVALQLGAFDYSEKKVHSKKITKPYLGQFKKANTLPKKFVKEIRGMEGFNLGDKVKADIFKPGEFVDVTGYSKGKGFQGTIKRHGQSIGPKSHGGGGGSKPVRLTGSIGTIAPARVFKGMTMPGHMGHEKSTMQNVEIIYVDINKELLALKGAVPGPKKGYLLIKEAIKKTPNKNPVKLVDLEEAMKKNELIEEAKKYGADINTSMSLEEMVNAVEAACAASEAVKKAEKEKEEAAVTAKEAQKLKEEAEKAQAMVDKAQNEEDKQVATEKAANLEKAAQVAKEKAAKEKVEADKATREASTMQKEAEELQVEADTTEEAKEEEKK